MKLNKKNCEADCLSGTFLLISSSIILILYSARIAVYDSQFDIIIIYISVCYTGPLFRLCYCLKQAPLHLSQRSSGWLPFRWKIYGRWAGLLSSQPELCAQDDHIRNMSLMSHRAKSKKTTEKTVWNKVFRAVRSWSCWLTGIIHIYTNPHWPCLL